MQDATISINLTVDQVNVVLASLAELPFKTSADLIINIRQQAQTQLESLAPPADAE